MPSKYIQQSLGNSKLKPLYDKLLFTYQMPKWKHTYNQSNSRI